MEVLWCKANVSALRTYPPDLWGYTVYGCFVHPLGYVHIYSIYPPVKHLCISVYVQKQWEYDVRVFVFHEFSIGDGRAGACRSAKKLQAMKKLAGKKKT
jgi:hypothetical protein